MDLLRIAARVALQKTYPFDVPAHVQVGEFPDDGLKVTQINRLEFVPIADINVPEIWSEDKLKAVQKDMADGKRLKPVRLIMNEDTGRWEINDGIHRTNASILAGYDYVPAVTTEYVPYGEEPRERTVDPI